MTAATAARTRMVHNTDLGNAKQLVAQHSGHIRYVATTGSWHVWNDFAWAVDDNGQVDRYARATVLRMQRRAADMEEGPDKEDAIKWAIAAENQARLKAMVEQAKAEPEVAARVDDFDGLAHELNTPAGPVDLRTGELRTPDPAAMHSKATVVRYIAGAKAPEWEKFIRTAIPDQATRRYVQRLLGLSLLGATMPEHQLPFLYGSGGTGKSTLLEIVSDVLGDYVFWAPRSLLQRKQPGAQSYDWASMRGRRLVIVEEVDGKLDEEALKQGVSQKSITARQPHERVATFRNVSALWMTSNKEPRFDGSDAALGRRLKVIAMDTKLEPTYVGPLKEHIAACEQEGVLSWLVRGSVLAHNRGVVEPAGVKASTSDMRDGANQLLEWADNALIMDPSGSATVAELHDSYTEWCIAAKRYNDYRSTRGLGWGRALREIGLEPGRSKGTRTYIGARLRAAPM